MDPRWQAWVESYRKAGYTDEQIRQVLTSKRYPASFVDSLIKPAKLPPPALPKRIGLNKNKLLIGALALLVLVGVALVVMAPPALKPPSEEKNVTMPPPVQRDRISIGDVYANATLLCIQVTNLGQGVLDANKLNEMRIKINQTAYAFNSTMVPSSLNPAETFPVCICMELSEGCINGESGFAYTGGTIGIEVSLSEDVKDYVEFSE